MVPFRYSRHPNLCYPNHFPRATNYPRTGNYPAGVMQVSYSRGWGGAIYKLNGVALLEADPPQWNTNTRQKSPICNPPLYIVLSFEPIIQFWIDSGFERS